LCRGEIPGIYHFKENYMPPAKKTLTEENTGQSEEPESTVASKPARKIAKKVEVSDLHVENPDDVISKINQEQVMVYMKSGYSYSSPEVSFTREKPFRLMNPIEAARLISSMDYRFEYANKEQVEEFYSLG
jgi:hypothetical protein